MDAPSRVTADPAWAALSAHQAKIKDLHLRKLFADDPGRAQLFSVAGAGLFVDYSKNRITEETVRLLLSLAQARGVLARRDAMFHGEKINNTEKRAVLHVALRAPRGTHIEVDGKDVVPDVHEVLDRMSRLRRRGPFRKLEGAHRQAHPERHQYRDRRFVSGSRNGLPRAAAVQRSIHDLPFRRERGWRRPY